jgi:hypothetical protein
MLRLKLIGYWRSAFAPQWPDPGAFVDPAWNTELRAHVVEYLYAGLVPWVSPGHSWCRFWCPGFGEGGLGSVERTDGEFLWPSGLAHYVRRHDVRLPDEFVAAITDRHVPALDPDQSWIDVPIDTDWWRSQRGFGSQAQTFLTPKPYTPRRRILTPKPYTPRGRSLIARTSGVALTATLLRMLRRFPEARSRSLSELREAILRGDDVLLVSGVTDFNLDELRRELDAFGVRTTLVDSTEAR